MNCTSEVCTILTKYVAPGCGVFTSTLIYAAPYNDVRKIDPTQGLGTLNPIPYAFIVANTLSWLLYGFLIRDYFIVGSNLAGLPLGIIYCLLCFAARPLRSARNIMLAIIGIGTPAVFLGDAFAFIMVNPTDPTTAKTISGWICIVVLCFFYTSPLATFYKVITTRDASSFSVSLSSACIVNTSLWTVYGLFTNDPYVWVPNAIGLVVSIIQIFFIFLFRKTSKKATESGDSYYESLRWES
eukprot:TRINITY_DN2207_c0_g1_i2.p1 TRINITY_DN2207_c0_g1~~TRINITY_DN2207_c0_g1_i2.p1  ORF type:complete len:274 (+),score=31.49 TRINITY_DN2207_c0_g1_i2:102-824(+)